MRAVLTSNSSIKCASAPLPPGSPVPTGPLHGGDVDKTGASKLKVNGEPVLLKSGIGPNVNSCQTTDTSTSPTPTTIPCKTVSSVTGGEATKLKVDGKGVMLADQLVGSTTGATPPNPLGILLADAKQTKLTAM
ncbi:hypothetical protein IQ273_18580 [Nodosilinea sp. LEGE 07298]|uniref:hypothetical protein n=1 Tax=Nodosilinea sp. LEGE 07298 TaxID=2777970 RepID=UPI0018818244|nr:hypothetical protein [Nodosilinea sp. LEGE 07298]MBE9111414.1 hypothetical protein [Nodosilinea sp. LEGE 07298]